MWWVVCVLVWQATLTAPSAQEWLASCLFAVPSAFAARAARRAVHGSWRLPADLPRQFVALVPAVIRDAVGALRLAAGRGRPAGDLTSLPLAREDSDARRTGREAAATIVVSATPGTLVLGVDRERDTLQLHALPLPTTRLNRLLRREPDGARS